MFDLHVGFLRTSFSCCAELETLLTLVSTFVMAYGCSSSFKELLRLPGISYSICMHKYIQGNDDFQCSYKEIKRQYRNVNLPSLLANGEAIITSKRSLAVLELRLLP